MIKTRKVKVSPEDFNKFVKEMSECRELVHKKPDLTKTTNHFRFVLYIYGDGRSAIKCATYDTKKKGVIEYTTYLDGRDVLNGPNGLQAYTTFSKYYQIPVIDKAKLSASPLIGYNEKYSGTRQEAYGYDLNSAYAYAMTRMWIDTTNLMVDQVVGPDQVGFRRDDDGELEMVGQGKFATFVFNKVPVPEGVKKFVNNWYNKKRDAKTAEEKYKAKCYLNYIVGYFQKKNPYLRAMIVCSCNNYIKSLLDEDSLFWNTDSIVSRKRRPDLEANLGVELGQWKLEHEGVVAYIENTYQWNDNQPTWRGIEKSRFKDGFDLLRDEIPPISNIYYFDWKDYQIKEI